MTSRRTLTPAEAGAALAATRPPLTPEQVEQVARAFVALDANKQQDAA